MSSFRIPSFHPVFLLLAILPILSISLAPAMARDNASSRDGILLAAFGTSVPEARAAFDKIEAAYRRVFPGALLEWAYTSSVIRKKLAKEGLEIKSIPEALDSLAKRGAGKVRAQSLHVLAGAEYAEFLHELEKWQANNPGRLEAIFPALPLLDSRADGERVLAALPGELAARSDAALALMAHGNAEGRAGLALEGMKAILRAKNPQIFLGSVEGEQSFEELLADLRNSGLQKVILAPFMLVAGDHARNDLAGDGADSWASRLRSEGFEVETHLYGLADLPEIADLFLDHTRKALKISALETVK